MWKTSSRNIINKKNIFKLHKKCEYKIYKIQKNLLVFYTKKKGDTHRLPGPAPPQRDLTFIVHFMATYLWLPEIQKYIYIWLYGTKYT